MAGGALRDEQQQCQDGGDADELFRDLDDRGDMYHIGAVKVVLIEDLQPGKKQQRRQHQHIPTQRQTCQPPVGEGTVGQPEQGGHQQEGEQEEEEGVADDDG